VPFNIGDKALIKIILAEFFRINCNRERLEMLLTEIGETCSTDRRHEIGILKHAHSVANRTNVTIVDEVVGLLNHKHQKQTYWSTRQIFKETDVKKSVASYKSFPTVWWEVY